MDKCTRLVSTLLILTAVHITGHHLGVGFGSVSPYEYTASPRTTRDGWNSARRAYTVMPTDSSTRTTDWSSRTVVRPRTRTYWYGPSTSRSPYWGNTNPWARRYYDAGAFVRNPWIESQTWLPGSVITLKDGSQWIAITGSGGTTWSGNSNARDRITGKNNRRARIPLSNINTREELSWPDANERAVSDTSYAAGRTGVSYSNRRAEPTTYNSRREGVSLFDANRREGVSLSDTNAHEGVSMFDANGRADVSVSDVKGQGISVIDANGNDGVSMSEANGIVGVSASEPNEHTGVSMSEPNGLSDVSVSEPNGLAGVSVSEVNGQSISVTNTSGNEGVSMSDANGRFGVSVSDANGPVGVSVSEANGRVGVSVPEANGHKGVSVSDVNEQGKSVINGKGNEGLSVSDVNGPVDTSVSDATGRVRVPLSDTNGLTGVSVSDFNVHGVSFNGNEGVSVSDTNGFAAADANRFADASLSDANRRVGVSVPDNNGRVGVSLLDANANGRADPLLQLETLDTTVPRQKAQFVVNLALDPPAGAKAETFPQSANEQPHDGVISSDTTQTQTEQRQSVSIDVSGSRQSTKTVPELANKGESTVQRIAQRQTVSQAESTTSTVAGTTQEQTISQSDFTTVIPPTIPDQSGLTVGRVNDKRMVVQFDRRAPDHTFDWGTQRGSQDINGTNFDSLLNTARLSPETVIGQSDTSINNDTNTQQNNSASEQIPPSLGDTMVTPQTEQLTQQPRTSTVSSDSQLAVQFDRMFRNGTVREGTRPQLDLSEWPFLSNRLTALRERMTRGQSATGARR